LNVGIVEEMVIAITIVGKIAVAACTPKIMCDVIFVTGKGGII
jgi:hypothetical protein